MFDLHISTHEGTGKQNSLRTVLEQKGKQQNSCLELAKRNYRFYFIFLVLQVFLKTK